VLCAWGLPGPRVVNYVDQTLRLTSLSPQADLKGLLHLIMLHVHTRVCACIICELWNMASCPASLMHRNLFFSSTQLMKVSASHLAGWLWPWHLLWDIVLSSSILPNPHRTLVGKGEVADSGKLPWLLCPWHLILAHHSFNTLYLCCMCTLSYLPGKAEILSCFL
jgi:hypothetical protein